MLSVIVPAHNEASVLSHTLSSLCEQLAPEDELIVVCDTCQDISVDIARTFTCHVYDERLGSAAQTRNFGAQKATKDVLVFIDADTHCAKNYVAAIKHSMRGGTEYGCAPLKSESGHWLGKWIAKSINRFNYTHCTFGGNCFVSTHLFKQLAGFNEALMKGEDTDLGERLCKLKAQYGWLAQSYIVHNERKFKEQGYIRYFSKLWLESVLWQVAPSVYQRVVGVKG
ncbi:glycosyltransferase [Pseudoalteromonas sp. MMG005]|uniref:glycosyltransferase n=1 Tax=Pseudoalteromonas sp. MMG005 TaxID=2822682 RepID=UPI001B3A4B07|nr:glycosyltransferase [Pseudoalteromonas sp. MMG005]MBQ4845307.1 glycosyltransferase [Pseudoalteromonas sp. MMG005]